MSLWLKGLMRKKSIDNKNYFYYTLKLTITIKLSLNTGLIMVVTQKDIARRLNVSVMTVSKALQNHPDISKKTIQLVQETAREMNYSVNVVARSLVQKRTRTIGILVPDISESFYAEIVRGAASEARKNDYTILLADSNNDPDLENEALHAMIEKRVDGMLIGPTEQSSHCVEFLRTIKNPFVIINSEPFDLNADSITVDRANGALQAVQYLLGKGFQDIYFLYTFKHMEQSKQSIEGCKKAFGECGKSVEELHLLYCENHEMETFYSTAKEKIRYQGRRMGIFVWDDEMAVGVLRAVTEKNWQIPDQAGIIGFDDIKISRYLSKALTTVFYPKFEMGQQGVKLLIQRLRDEQDLPVRKIYLPLELRKRETA